MIFPIELGDSCGEGSDFFNFLLDLTASVDLRDGIFNDKIIFYQKFVK